MVEKKQKELLIIIPAYNEEKNIERVLEELERPEIAEIADILVMNDASSDSTNWVVKAHGHTLVSHVFNLGYGSALQLGYKYAIRRKYSYVIQMDADGQHDVCNIPVIYQRLKQQDADGRCRISCSVRVLWREVQSIRSPLRRNWHTDSSAG